LVRGGDFSRVASSPTRQLVRLRETCVATETIRSAKRLDHLNIRWTQWVGLPQKGGNKPLEDPINFKRILPSLACIPEVIASSGYGPSAWRTAAERLFFFVNEISSGKSRLEVKDILTLGEEAAKDPEHDLYFFAEIVQEEEMAQEIVSRWNERYPHGAAI